MSGKYKKRHLYSRFHLLLLWSLRATAYALRGQLQPKNGRGGIQSTHRPENEPEITGPNPVHIKSSFIMNGVCVRWRGWMDLERLDGLGCLEYNEERAQAEDALLKEQIERYNQRLREFEDKRSYRSQQERADQDLDVWSNRRRVY